MDYLEMEQFTEALNYIEEYSPEKKYSDEDFDRILNSFQRDEEEIKQIISRNTYSIEIYRPFNKGISEDFNGRVKCNNSVTCGIGSTDRQLSLFRTILLSARFNYKKYEKKLASEKAQIEDNMENGTYDGKDIREFEKLRQKAAKYIKDTPETVGKIQFLAGHGNLINKGLKNIVEYKIFKEAAVSKKIAASAKRMIADGLSLTQISNCLNTDLPFIYKLAQNAGLPFVLSAEEEEIIKNAENLPNEPLPQNDRIFKKTAVF